MKHVLLIVAMILVVVACNLTSKFKKTESTNSNSSSTTSSSGNPTKIGDDPVEKAEPTAAQTAALANGQEVKWTSRESPGRCRPTGKRTPPQMTRSSMDRATARSDRQYLCDVNRLSRRYQLAGISFRRQSAPEKRRGGRSEMARAGWRAWS